MFFARQSKSINSGKQRAKMFHDSIIQKKKRQDRIIEIQETERKRWKNGEGDSSKGRFKTNTKKKNHGLSKMARRRRVKREMKREKRSTL